MYNYGFYQQQPMTDIGQVNSEQEAVNAYVAAGRSKIMFSSDDKTGYVKCVSMNGQVSMDVFDRRAAAPAQTKADFVTKEDLEKALAALKAEKEESK